MRGVTSTLTLFRPRSLDEALRILRDERPLTPIAGCTDLYVALNAGTLPETLYLDLQPLDALRGVRVRGKKLVIGAMTTWTEIRRSSLIAKRLPMLAEAARQIGGRQIQNRGTLGGNIGNGSPAADGLPPLLAADAVVVLQSHQGERRVPFSEYYVGYRRSVLRRDELITAVEVPPVRGRQWFRKVGTRAAQAISKVVIAGVRGRDVRFALGSVGPIVLRARRTEAHLAAGGSLAEACAILATEITPIDDLRSTAAYRLRVSQNLLARFWRDTSRG